MANVEDLEPHILDKYSIIQRLGKGAYGVVWRGVNKETKEEVAIKKVETPMTQVYDAFHNSTDAQRTFREVMFLKELANHENVVKLHGLIRAQNANDLYLVFEFMEIDLHAVIRGNILEEVHKQYVIYQILKALKYIHSANIIHRDLKPSNILLNTDCLVKIADFGLARSINKEDDEGVKQILTEYIATRWYRAPEIVLGSHYYSKAIDVWSVGCIMAEMITGKAPFPGKSTINQIELIIELLGRPTREDLDSLDSPLAFNVMENIKATKQRSFTQTFAKASPEAIDLLRRLLCFNPKKRITIEEALKHPYLKAFHFPEEEKEFHKKKIEMPISDNIKLTRHDYKKALHKLIDEKELEDDKKDPKRSLSKGHQMLRDSREGLDPREKDSKTSGSRISTDASKYNSQKGNSYQNKENRNVSRSKDKPYVLGHYTDSNETMSKKNDSFVGESKKLTNSRDNLRNISQNDNSYLHSSIDKHLQKDHSISNLAGGLESRMYKADPKHSAALNASHSRKLLNASGERSILKTAHDDKENNQRLANKQNYYSKYIRQSSDYQQSKDYESHNHSTMAKGSHSNAANNSLEALKSAYHKYEQQNRSTLIKTAGTQLNTSGAGAEKSNYNVLGSRILKKLKKNSSGTTMNPDQILKTGGVYENRYLYNAILNSTKSRPKLANNPFKVIE